MKGWLAASALLIAGAARGQAPALPVARQPSSAAVPSVAAGSCLASFVGEVAVLRPGDALPQPVAAAPTQLRAGDKVIAAPGASAVLRLADASQVRLGAGSELTIAAQKPGVVVLLLASGKLWAEVAASAERRFEVRTAGAVAAAHEARFSVTALDAQATAAEVYAGAVAVDGLRKGKPLGEPVLVLAGQRAEVLGGFAPEKVRTILGAAQKDAAAGAFASGRALSQAAASLP